MTRIVNSAGEPAFASACSEGVVSCGLTKRELFAGLAMQGLLGSDLALKALVNAQVQVARHAVVIADALLAELAKEASHADD